MPTYLENAHDFNLGTLNILAPQASRKDRQVLYSKAVSGAIYDSEERCDAPKCHPETRKAVQQDVVGWIRAGDNEDEPKKIMWITGPAGTGKTAIAGSVAETCDEEGLLAATFFFSSFSGSAKRRLKRGLVVTLVYQLIQLDGMESVERHVLSAIQRNPAIFDARLQKQMEVLMLRPLRERQASGLPPISARAIVIDGLDEVEHPDSNKLEKAEARSKNEADQVEILCALHHAASDPIFPFRILIASRPERVIRDFFLGNANQINHSICRKIDLHEQYNAEADIRLFLTAKFAEIRRRYRLAASWPDEQTLERLVDTASGQFIYASTVIRFLQDGRHSDPRSRLLHVLDWRSRDEGVDGLKPLDALYTRILESSSDPSLAGQWLAAIDDFSGDGFPALFINQFLEDFEGEAEHLLENLTSLVDIPPVDLEDDIPYEFYHKSFSEFLRRRYRDYDGDHLKLMKARCCRILKTQSPARCSSDSQWRVFIDNFIDIFFVHGQTRVCFGVEAPRVSPALPCCDAAWWLRGAVTGGRYISFLQHLFCDAHNECEKGNLAVMCRPSCKVWRSAILRTCKSERWRAPDVFDLLVLHLGGGVGALSDGPTDFLRDCLGPPHWLRPKLEGPFRSLLVKNSCCKVPAEDADYEALCETIDDLHSHLPDGWGDQFVYAGDDFDLDEARSKVRGVLRRLGVNVDGVCPILDPPDSDVKDLDEDSESSERESDNEGSESPEHESDNEDSESPERESDNEDLESPEDESDDEDSESSEDESNTSNPECEAEPSKTTPTLSLSRTTHQEVAVARKEPCHHFLPTPPSPGPIANDSIFAPTDWNLAVDDSNTRPQSPTFPLDPEFYPSSESLVAPSVPDVLADFHFFATGFMPTDLLDEAFTLAYGDPDSWGSVSFSLPSQGDSENDFTQFDTS